MWSAASGTASCERRGRVRRSSLGQPRDAVACEAAEGCTGFRLGDLHRAEDVRTQIREVGHSPIKHTRAHGVLISPTIATELVEELVAQPVRLFPLSLRDQRLVPGALEEAEGSRS